MSEQSKSDTPSVAAPFVLKDSVMVEGLTENFVWYESEVILRQMEETQSRLKKLVAVMESRHTEHLRMIAGLLDELSQLKKEINERS
jgi:exonuclease VII large subunit